VSVLLQLWRLVQRIHAEEYSPWAQFIRTPAEVAIDDYNLGSGHLKRWPAKTVDVDVTTSPEFQTWTVLIFNHS